MLTVSDQRSAKNEFGEQWQAGSDLLARMLAFWFFAMVVSIMR
jgi:hypothetical protein